jgi:hypothetical protein
VAYDAATSRVITPDGKQLPIDEVWKRLKPNTIIAISADSNTPDNAYLRALNPETLVLIPGPRPSGIAPQIFPGPADERPKN